jgi:hypothetical protein
MTKEETVGRLADSDYYEDNGYQPIESTVYELGGLGVAVKSGDDDYFTFNPFADLVVNYPDRLVRGWYNKEHDWMEGDIHMQCTERETEDIWKISGTWFNPEWDSDWEGFYIFKTE